jgi:hypothetical protein
MRRRFDRTHAATLRFLHVKIPKKASDSEQKDSSIQSMKQNIEVMNQVLKNVSSLSNHGWYARRIGQPYCSIEVVVEKELIKYIVAVPADYTETFEKFISSFYPGSVIDNIDQPKLCETGKYRSGASCILSKSYHYPLKTYDSFEVDPMDSVLASCSRIEYDEKLVVQCLISPLDEWRQQKIRKQIDLIKDGKSFGFWSTLWSAFKSKSDEDKSPDKKSHRRSSTQLSDLEKKWEDELFQVNIRVLATSPQPTRPKTMVQDITRTLNQYNYSGFNSLTTKERVDLAFLYAFIERRFISHGGWYNFFRTRRTILNIKELSSIIHFPNFKFNKNPRIKRQNYKIVPAPDTIPQEWMLLGYNLYGGVKKEVRMKFEDRFRHFYCIGQTGTGKTTNLLTMAKEDLKAWYGFCFIDPHGDFCEDLISYFPKDRIDDLIYFNAADFNYPLWLNVFQVQTEEEKDVIISDLIDMFVSMYGHEIFGPRIQDYFRNAAMCLMEQPDGGTISEVVRLFTDQAYQKIKVKNIQNPVVRQWREKTYGSMGDREKQEMIPYFQAKFSPFTDSGIVRNIVWQPKSSFSMDEAMQQNKVILVNLSKWLIGETNSQLIGRFLSTQIKVAALRRANMDISERKPFFLYIDEFQNYVSKSIESVLSEARKYRLWLGIAHQYIDQIRWDGKWWVDLSKAIFGNVGNILSLKVWAPDAEFLEKEFSPEFSQQDLVNMDKFRGIMKLSVDSMQTRPFSFAPINPLAEPKLNNKEKAWIIKQISALKRWRKKDLVEKEIFFRVGV